MKALNLSLFAFLFFALSLVVCPNANAEDKMWVVLTPASGTATFKIHLPNDGCLSIIAAVQGRKQKERIWGPRFMNKGTYRLAFPQRRILGKEGIVELFNIELIPDKTVGQRGRGERQFSHPKGIDWDPVRKEILVADTGNDRIVKLDNDGRFKNQYGGFGLTFGDKSEEREDSLDEPYDVAAGGFSNFYVSDQHNRRICIFDMYKSYKGNLFPTTDDRDNRLTRPRGIKVDSENNIWLVDGREDKVFKISPNGDMLFSLGGYGWSSLQLRDPTQIDIDSQGQIYIADHGNGRIAVFDRLGSFIMEIKDHLKSPTGVAVDDNGLIYICDDSTSELGMYTPRGTRLAWLNSTSEGSLFRQPSDLVSTNNKILLVDSGKHRIVFISKEKTSISVPWNLKADVIK